MKNKWMAVDEYAGDIVFAAGRPKACEEQYWLSEICRVQGVLILEDL